MTTAIPTIAVFPEERLSLSEKVEKWTWQLCRALEENYRQDHKRMVQNNSVRFNADGSKELSDYAQQQLDAMEDGTANLMRFRIQKGKKYYKIIQQDFDTFRDRNEYRDGGVHAFVDKKTGENYKAASWKSPAKYVRYDMRIIKEREYVLNPVNCGWAGGYLYMR